MQEEPLDASAGGSRAEEACRDHTGVVQHEHVARVQVLDDVAEGAVVQRFLRAVDHEQARRVARLGRLLSDQLGR